jgi:DNA-binding MarR family transcriptional regulator
MSDDPDQSGGSWTLLTGHGHVLVEIARNPGARIRDISAVVGLAERTVQAIVADLEAAGYQTAQRYTWPALARQVAAVYMEMTGKPRPA